MGTAWEGDHVLHELWYDPGSPSAPKASKCLTALQGLDVLWEGAGPGSCALMEISILPSPEGPTLLLQLRRADRFIPNARRIARMRFGIFLALPERSSTIFLMETASPGALSQQGSA